MNKRWRWGQASVQYRDWEGTIAMDKPNPIEQIEDYARIDDNWVVLGLELYGGTEARLNGTTAWVVAMERAAWERLGGVDEISAGQRLLVTRFPIRDIDAVGILQLMKRWSIHAWIQSVARAQLVIVDDAEEPNQGRNTLD